MSSEVEKLLKIEKLLESAIREYNMCLDEYTANKMFVFISQAFAFFRKPKCPTCGDSKIKPRRYDMCDPDDEPCPTCREPEQHANKIINTDVKPEPSELLPWQKRLMEEYDRKRFLELIERYNQKLSGVWDNDFTIKGSELLTIISLGWGAIFIIDRQAGEIERLKSDIQEYRKMDKSNYVVCGKCGKEYHTLKLFDCPHCEQALEGE